MNKNIIILLVAMVIIAGSFFYRAVFLKGTICTAEQGEDVEIDVVSRESQWVFDPPGIKINKCDRVTLNIFNEDDYDHGFAIDVFGINKRLNPNSTTTVNFTASRAGEFISYCSVPCGEGHFGHKGTVSVVEFLEQN